MSYAQIVYETYANKHAEEIALERGEGATAQGKLRSARCAERRLKSTKQQVREQARKQTLRMVLVQQTIDNFCVAMHGVSVRVISFSVHV